MADETIDQETVDQLQDVMERYPKAQAVGDIIAASSDTVEQFEALAKGVHDRLSATEQRAEALAAADDQRLEEQRRKMDGAFTNFAPDHATRKVWAADVPDADEHGNRLEPSERMAAFVKRMNVAPPKDD